MWAAIRGEWVFKKVWNSVWNMLDAVYLTIRVTPVGQNLRFSGSFGALRLSLGTPLQLPSHVPLLPDDSAGGTTSRRTRTTGPVIDA